MIRIIWFVVIALFLVIATAIVTSEVMRDEKPKAQFNEPQGFNQ